MLCNSDVLLFNEETSVISRDLIFGLYHSIFYHWTLLQRMQMGDHRCTA
jgi:hypothetical protein